MLKFSLAFVVLDSVAIILKPNNYKLNSCTIRYCSTLLVYNLEQFIIKLFY